MEKIKIILLFSILPIIANGQNYLQGDKLNVLSPFGAEVRETPSNKSEMIFKLEYGEEIEVMEITPESADTIEYKSGNWILIAAQFGTGYVFDGNLSKLKLPNPEYVKNNDLLSYFRNQYPKTSCGAVYDRPEIGMKRVIDSIQVHDSIITVVATRTYWDNKFEEKEDYWNSYDFIIEGNRFSEMITLVELFYHQKNGEQMPIKWLISDSYFENKKQIMFTYSAFDLNTIVMQKGVSNNKITVEKF